MDILHGQYNRSKGLILNRVLTLAATRILPPPIPYHRISLERPHKLADSASLSHHKVVFGPSNVTLSFRMLVLLLATTLSEA